MAITFILLLTKELFHLKMYKDIIQSENILDLTDYYLPIWRRILISVYLPKVYKTDQLLLSWKTKFFAPCYWDNSQDNC